MAITRVQSNPSSSTSNSFSTGTQAGNTIIVAIYDVSYSGVIPVVSDDHSNTYTLDGSNKYVYVFSAHNVAAGTKTISVSGISKCDFLIAEYSGLASSSYNDGVSTVSGNTGTLTTGNITTTDANDLLIAVWCASSSSFSSPGVSISSPYTIVSALSPGTADSSFHASAAFLCEDIVSSLGTYSASANISSAVNSYGVLVGYKDNSAPSVISPSVSNISASNITSNNATIGGNVTNTGGENPDRKIYWGTTDGGTTAANWTNSYDAGVSGVGTYTDTLTGLSPNTTYYFRAYASNSAGESWASSSSSFGTQVAALSELTTVSGQGNLTMSQSLMVVESNSMNNESNMTVNAIVFSAILTEIASVTNAGSLTSQQVTPVIAPSDINNEGDITSLQSVVDIESLDVVGESSLTANLMFMHENSQSVTSEVDVSVSASVIYSTSINISAVGTTSALQVIVYISLASISEQQEIILSQISVTLVSVTVKNEGDITTTGAIPNNSLSESTYVTNVCTIITNPIMIITSLASSDSESNVLTTSVIDGSVLPQYETISGIATTSSTGLLISEQSVILSSLSNVVVTTIVSNESSTTVSGIGLASSSASSDLQQSVSVNSQGTILIQNVTLNQENASVTEQSVITSSVQTVFVDNISLDENPSMSITSPIVFVLSSAISGLADLMVVDISINTDRSFAEGAGIVTAYTRMPKIRILNLYSEIDNINLLSYYNILASLNGEYNELIQLEYESNTKVILNGEYNTLIQLEGEV